MSLSNLHGKFITIEGSEGVGKTTQIKKLVEFLESNNVKHLVTREPGGTPLAEKIRNIILDKDNDIPDDTELLLLFAARVSHLQQVILPALLDGCCVICDRYIDSTYAYQVFARGVNINKINVLMKNFDIKIPDLTILLDFENVAMALSRATAEENDRIEAEKISFFNKVRKGFIHQALNNSRIRTIDSSFSKSDIHDCIIYEIEQFVKNN